ncbi:bacillithiol biosynthesis cysteine-adding enzyme BshC [Flavobacteriaceae bacterium MHTCC 0001]
MQQEYLPFKNTGYFSSLICDYLDERSDLKPFYNRFPNIKNVKAQIDEKRSAFEQSGGGISKTNRKVLTEVLQCQYTNVEVSELTSQNIEHLNSENTFTITTGHQLNLFTGPLYFLYKIVSAINLSNQLKEAYPEYNFVPVYWMATEDHDFDEINYFNFKGKKFQWNRSSSGAVGELSTEGLDAVLELFSQDLGASNNAQGLKKLFENAYLTHTNLTDATRFLANELFKDYGLVIIDASATNLKRLFLPYVEKELINQVSYKSVSVTNKTLAEVDEAYKIQVNPREINLFYLKDNIRERIVFEDGNYKVLNTKIIWSEGAILKHLREAPERFSPNVIMRPLYQEVILPNLCYIGGGGELAYWLQLKSYFDAVNIQFPILLLRNSVLVKSEKQSKKLDNLNISNEDIFLKRDTFINKKVRQISNIDIDFSPKKELLTQQFRALYKLAEQTDKSFYGAVKAQEQKQLKGLKKLEQRLLQAQKRKLSDEVSRMVEIQNQLFPNGSLQERNANFSEFYLEYGERLIPLLVSALDPLHQQFSILTI